MKELRNKIDSMIMESTKAREKEKTEVFKAIKNEFLVFKTAKNAKPLDDAAEISILQKMVKQREDSATQFEAGGRSDLAENERYEISVLKELLPKMPTKADIEEYIHDYYMDGIPKAQMGMVIKNVKVALPGADGKMVADVVKANLI